MALNVWTFYQVFVSEINGKVKFKIFPILYRKTFDAFNFKPKDPNL